MIYVTRLPTATHFKLSPRSDSKAKALPSASKLSITPVKPKYNKGFLPNLSVKYIATIVIKKFTTPIPVVAYIAFKLESKPASLNIVGA